MNLYAILDDGSDFLMRVNLINDSKEREVELNCNIKSEVRFYTQRDRIIRLEIRE